MLGQKTEHKSVEPVIIKVFVFATVETSDASIDNIVNV